jgi:hypothetical protein
MNLDPGIPSKPQPTTHSGASGELRELIRSKDWPKTPLGPIDAWSPMLKTTVEFVLANRFPIMLLWGPDYISIYNDAYRPILGSKHPSALGLPFTDVWPEISHVLLPLIDAPFNGGPATWVDDIELIINRHGFVEESHFTIAYSPVSDDAAPGGVGGVIATAHENTEKIIGERRIAALRDLSACAGEAKSAEEACAIAADALYGHTKDIPFASIFLLDEKGDAYLAAATAAPDGFAALDKSAWPLAEVQASKIAVVVEDPTRRPGNIPPGPNEKPPRTAVVMPIRTGSANQVAGILVAGVSPRIRLDDQYRNFLDLVAAQVSTAITNGRTYEEKRNRAAAPR